MAQGTRGRWVRVATTGLGVLLCTGLVGCLNSDKDKKDKLTKQPTPGLHGTPMIGQNGPNGQPITKSGQPNNQFGAGSGIQQTGGVGAARPGGVGSTPPGYNPNYGSNNWVQPGAVQPGAPTQPIGVNVQPSNFQPVGASPPGNWVNTNTNPPVPNNIVASAPPGLSSGFDPLPPPARGSEFGSTVQPPTNNNFAPIAPSARPGKGTW